MALEDLTGTKYLDSLNSSNPTATDPKSEGDDHVRGIKNVLKTTFPNISGAVNATHTEINELDASAAAISNFGSGIRTYLYNANSARTRFDADTVIAVNGAAESIGPTGSSATNIWTAMDAMPSGCAAVILDVDIDVDPTTSGVATYTVAFRATGTSVTDGPKVGAGFHADNGLSVQTHQQIIVPLDSSNRFDAQLLSSNATGSDVDFRLAGFIA